MKKKSDNSDSRKNVVVLTIITIATMIVVLVGATFAYLAASVQTSDEQTVNVTTNGTNDILLIDAGKDIEISASESNFGISDTDLTDYTYSTVTLQTSNTTGVTYNYKVSFDASGDGTGSNNFEYTTGTCYSKTTLSENNETSYVACKNAGKLWAKVGDASYACYESTATEASTNFQESASSCLLKASNMWALDPVTEIALDVYIGDTSKNQANCMSYNNGGICVNKYRSETSATSESTCNNDETNRWISNVYEDGVCYIIDETYDVTELKSTMDIYYDDPVSAKYEGHTISATNATMVNYYLARVSLINLKHNQRDNGNKELIGHVQFTVENLKED